MQEAGSGFTPVTQSERIHTMDVLRGFALLGIFMVNVQWAVRPYADSGNQFPAGLSAIDGWINVFVHVAMESKFWTLFSLLFGMGFAVMLERATQAGRGFIAPYLRRAFALALFGLFNHLVLGWWADILLAYAVTALFLLLLLFARWYWLLLLAMIPLVPFVGFGYFVPGVGGYMMLFVFIMAMHFRSDASVPLFGVRWHVSALCSWALALWWLSKPLIHGNVTPQTLINPVMFVMTGLFSQYFRQPPEQRAWRLGVWWYVAMGAFLSLLHSVVAWWHPVAQPAEAVAQQVAEQAAAVNQGLQAIQGNSWWALMQYRLHEDYWNQGSYPVLAVFLIGFWFIRSGVMRNVRAHLPLFRKLAYLALPAGVLLSIVGVWIAPNAIIGKNDAQYRFAHGLQMLAGLLGAFGYLGLVTVLMQGAAAKWLALLAPAGRMALTNYLMQSVLMGLFFYGYGLGHYGMGRAGQFAFVLVVYAAQVVFSHLWLRYFRYGPFEWLWRSITYWRWQPFRVAVA